MERQNEKTAGYQFNCAQDFYHLLEKRDLHKLHQLSDGKRPHVMKALSNLSKFLGVHQEYLKLVKQHGLSWGGKDTDQVVIDRLTKVKDPDEVFQWIRKVKEARSDLAHLIDLIALTGLRLVESVDAYNLIIRLADEDQLCEYYDRDKEALEHYRFKDKVIRRTKKAFISYVPQTLIKKILEDTQLPSTDGVISRIKKTGLNSRFSDVREAHATFMTRFLEQSEIDFLHGRVSANVFMSNYFNPALIKDLKERTFRGIDEIKNKIS